MQVGCVNDSSSLKETGENLNKLSYIVSSLICVTGQSLDYIIFEMVSSQDETC